MYERYSYFVLCSVFEFDDLRPVYTRNMWSDFVFLIGGRGWISMEECL